MFTGIITYLGTLKEKQDTTLTFTIPQTLHKRMYEGASLAVNGTCLTVTKKGKNSFSVEVIPETLRKTMLGQLKLHDLVNLELPATPETFLSGHIVQGHINGVGEIVRIAKDGNSKLMTMKVSPILTRSIVRKGSIAVNGVSLTVIAVAKDTFTIGIIPYTWQHTMFHMLNTGDSVNIEVDILSKYIAKLVKRS